MSFKSKVAEVKIISKILEPTKTFDAEKAHRTENEQSSIRGHLKAPCLILNVLLEPST